MLVISLGEHQGNNGEENPPDGVHLLAQVVAAFPWRSVDSGSLRQLSGSGSRQGQKLQDATGPVVEFAVSG